MGVLIDTSVWIDHFRKPEPQLAALVQRSAALMHPYATGELALGHFRDRVRSLTLLLNLPAAPVVEQRDLLIFIDAHGLAGSGVGFVDAHLLASSARSGVTLWTRDKRLRDHAQALGCCAEEA